MTCCIIDNDTCPLHLRSLRNFLFGHFHQDLETEYGTIDSALLAAIAEASDVDRRAAFEELIWLLEQNYDEATLRKIASGDLYCDYLPDEVAPWLKHVKSELARSLVVGCDRPETT